MALLRYAGMELVILVRIAVHALWTVATPQVKYALTDWITIVTEIQTVMIVIAAMTLIVIVHVYQLVQKKRVQDVPTDWIMIVMDSSTVLIQTVNLCFDLVTCRQSLLFHTITTESSEPNSFCTYLSAFQSFSHLHLSTRYLNLYSLPLSSFNVSL